MRMLLTTINSIFDLFTYIHLLQLNCPRILYSAFVLQGKAP